MDIKREFDMLYVQIMSDGMGNTSWSDYERSNLQKTKRLLAEKYGDTDFRVRFLAQCIILEETHEFRCDEREWVRYILHQESEPNSQHERLLKELEEKMKK